MKKIRFALAQMNPTVGDYAANARKILRWIRAAESQRSDLIVFPELALCGYPVWDLANKRDFVDQGLSWVERIAAATRSMNITVALGVIDREESVSQGSPRGIVQHHPGSLNSLFWISKGKVRARQAKRLLPTYDVFLEDIFFQPSDRSSVIPWKGNKVAPTICEDIWDDRYRIKPLKDLRAQGANIAVNISASPHYRGVSDIRDALIKKQTIRHGMPLVYVNQVGAQDDLVFDGRSLFCDAHGRLIFRAPAFEEGLFYVDSDPAKETAALPADSLSGSPQEMYEALVLGVRDYCRKNGFERVLIGLSGGIDSALVAALAADALGPKAVLGVTMPGTYSSRGSWQDSEDLAERLGIEFRNHAIDKKYKFLVSAYRRDRVKEGGKVAPRDKITLAMENLQARIRGMELMYLSNDENRLLLTTGNKSELAMGYCTLYGDMAGGLAVLGDVYKTDVYRLSLYRNTLSEVIPRPILTKAPSAELRPNQKDQDSLPPYEILDEILYLYIEKNCGRDEIKAFLGASGAKAAMVNSVIRKVDHNEYKRRQTPPILRVTGKAWFGRRMPITNRFDSH